MSEMNLPQGWTRVRLNDLVKNPKSDLVDGPFGSNLKSSEYVESGVPVLKIQNIKANRFVEKRLSYVTSEKAAELSRHSFIAGDLMITKLGEPLGLCCEVPSHLEHGIFVADLMRLRPSREIINSKFLLHAINSVVVQNQFKEITKGTTRQRVNLTIVRDINIDLPPIAEQHRIVAKIEELFSELDKGIENLKTAREQLKVYRQALLKHAFEGKLTAQWRAANPDKLEPAAAMLARIQTEREQRYRQQLQQWETTGGSKPKAPKPLPPLTADELAELPELPEGWGWTRLGNTNVDVSDGPFGSNLKSSDYVDSGVRVVRLENIGALEFIEDKESYVTEAKYELLKNHTVLPGDIVFSSFITENVRVALVPSSISKAINKADCFCVRLHGETLSNRFAVMFLSTRHVYKQLEAQIHGVGRPRINTTQLKEVAIPVCCAEEQQAMLEQIESRLSEADQLDQTLAAALQQSEALRQSILKRAFSGQLVAQDENDEPAAALLARIRAERATAEESSVVRKKSKRG